MADQVYQLLEVTGTSTKSIEDAIENGVGYASTLGKSLKWFQVTETRGFIDGDKVGQWQVTLKIGAGTK